MRSLIPYLAYVYIGLVGATARLRVIGAEHIDAAREMTPSSRFIYAFWHCQQVFLVYTHRNTHAVILVSRSRDGDIIAKTMALFGINSSRGSSSRGAAAATLALMDCAAAGHDIGVTPDGPRGPALEVKPGILYLAQKLKIPILPLATAQSRRLIIKRSWDQFHIPLPFSRAALVYGKPLYIQEDDDIATQTLALKESLDAISRQAEEAVA